MEVVETDSPGNYRVTSEDKLADLFAVNLFDHQESNLTVAPSVELGYKDITARVAGVEIRKEYWRWLLLAMLIMIAGEWWLYVKRVA